MILGQLGAIWNFGKEKGSFNLVSDCVAHQCLPYPYSQYLSGPLPNVPHQNPIDENAKEKKNAKKKPHRVACCMMWA
jgi:hypothetical protein